MDSPLVIIPSYVRKPTALIHFERELSVVAQKVMTLIVAHCQRATKNPQGFYVIEKRRVCDALGWEASCNYLRVIVAFEEIYNNSLIWNLFGQDRTFKYLKCRLIVSLWVPEEAAPYIGFQLHSKLEAMIRSPKVFGQILLEVPALLTRSEYAFPLYELLADHVSREEGVMRIALIDLKRYLGLKGRYSAFPMFKGRVLMPSLDSINTSTDLHVSYETWRTGRGIGGLVFHVQRQSQPAKSPNTSGKTLAMIAPPTSTAIPEPWSRPTEEQSFLERLARHQISETDAIQAVQQHGLEGARDIFGYVRQEVAQRKGTPQEIRNVSAYLARCLREGYGRKGEIERDAAQAQAARAERRARRQAAQTADAAQEQAQAREKATLEAQTAEAVAQWLALSEAQRADLEQRFLQEEPIWAMRPADSVVRLRAFERWLAQQSR